MPEDSDDDDDDQDPDREEFEQANPKKYEWVML